MATGLKAITSYESEGSTVLIAGKITNAASATGDGWSMARSGTGIYTITLTNKPSAIFAVLSSLAYTTEAVLLAQADTADTGGIGVVTAHSASAGTVTFSVYGDVDNVTADGAAEVLPADVELHFCIVASHFGA